MKKLNYVLKRVYLLFLPFFTIGLLTLGIINFYLDDDSLATFLFANIGCLLAIVYYSLFLVNSIIDFVIWLRKKKESDNE